MLNEKPSFADALKISERALSRWNNEEGASRQGPQESAIGGHAEPADAPRLSDAELVQLRVRVVALENLVIALLAEGPDRQIAVAREMATYISPRPGCTHHPLTIHAASHMIDLLQPAGCFRTGDAAEPSLPREADFDG